MTSSTEINFLDIKVYLDSEQNLQTTIYRKPTGGSYLDFHSFHTVDLKLSRPYCSAVRASRICSTREDLEENFRHIFAQFIRQNFPINIIQNAISKVQRRPNPNVAPRYPNSNPRSKNRLNVQNAPKLSTTFATNMPNLGHILRKHFYILQRAKPEVYSDLPMVVFRRSRNTQDILVSSNFTSQLIKPNGLSTCGDIRCDLCDIQIRGSDIKNIWA